MVPHVSYIVQRFQTLLVYAESLGQFPISSHTPRGSKAGHVRLEVSVKPVGWILDDFALADQLLQISLLPILGRKANRISENEAAEWLDYVKESASSGSFFSSLSGFIVSGLKPKNKFRISPAPCLAFAPNRRSDREKTASP